MTESNETLNRLDEPKLKVPNQGLGKLVFLGFLTLVLSVKGPLLLFAPIPMIIAFLTYGYTRAFSCALFMIGLSIGISFTSVQLATFSTYGITMISSVLTAFLVSSIIVSNEHPVKGVFKKGAILVGLVLTLFAGYQLFAENSLTQEVYRLVEAQIELTKNDANYQELVKAGGEHARSYQMALDNPDEIAKTILNWIFSATFVGGFFLIWISFFMILRNKKIWDKFSPYDYSTKDLVDFKVPEQLTYVVIFGLVSYLGAEYIGMPMLEVIGMNIVVSLGVFYFFQGMGIYIEFLNFLKIRGFIRSFLTLLTIFFAFRFIAVIGFFDLWANFKKYMKKL